MAPQQARATAPDNLFRCAFDTAPIGFARESIDGQPLFANPALCAMLGFTEEELRRKHCTDFSPREDAETDHALSEQLRKGSIEKYHLEKRFIRKDGSLMWGRLSVSLMKAPAPSRPMVVAVVEDITEKKKAEQEQRHIAVQLERERARLVEAEEVANMGSWEGDLESLNVIWSDQTHRIFETDPASFHPTRTKFREFIHPEDCKKVDAAFVASINRRSPSTVEYRIAMSDGRIKFIEERWQAFRDERGKPVRLAGTCRDITERVRAEEELKRLSQEVMRTQDNERRDLARGLHESVGQTLAALKMTLGNLEYAIAEGSEGIQAHLNEARGLAEDAVCEVRVVSYLMHPPMLDEAGLGPALTWYVRGFSERSRIKAALEITPDLGRYPQEIETTIFRIVQESLTNVHRHSGSPTVTIRLVRESGQVRAEIQDEGCGLPLISQGGSQNLRLGVGIAGMRERVAQAKGAFEIESKPGRGTTIRVVLPSDPSEA